MNVMRYLTGLGALLFALHVMPLRAEGATTLDPTTFDLSGPSNGWRHSGLIDELEQGTAAYPKPPVDRGAQKYRTLIAGQIKATQAIRLSAHQLIVNGNAMPLYTDEQGYFARPYAFGRGANNVEIRTADGKIMKRVQFYDAYTAKLQAKLRVILTWDDPHAEVDLHVITPQGEHAFWAAPLLAAGGGLDVDSVDGAGPEIFSSSSPMSGNWLFYINYWGNFNEGGYNFKAGANDRTVITARISIISNENTVAEKRETFVVPLRKIGDLTLARTVRM